MDAAQLTDDRRPVVADVVAADAIVMDAVAASPFVAPALVADADVARAVVIRISETAARRGSPGITQRAFDVIFALVMLVVTSPVMLMVALMVRCTSRGPVLYLHERVGRDGRTFRMAKFRTMYRDADQRLADLLRDDRDLRAEFERDFKLRHDPRVTAVGRFLRRTSLDELPQFLNVLRGDMSVVGPRPIVSRELSRYGRHAFDYLAARPGVTGLWQVSGRNDLSYDERVQLDVAYLRSRNLRVDLGIIARTIPVMLFARGGC